MCEVGGELATEGCGLAPMTRAEARKQVNTGWITAQLAALLMGFDLDSSRLDAFVETGAVRAQTGPTGRVLSVTDLTSVSDLEVNKALDKLWPIDRRRKTARVQTMRVLATQTAQEAFNRRWFRLHRRVAKLVADPDANLSYKEMKLIHQLMALSRKVRGFELLLTNRQLMDLTRLDDEWLPKTRRALEGRDLIRVTSGGPVWVYTLLDPKTKQPFEEDDEDGPVLVASGTWADLDHA